MGKVRTYYKGRMLFKTKSVLKQGLVLILTLIIQEVIWFFLMSRTIDLPITGLNPCCR